jgi:hypothetical protein
MVVAVLGWRDGQRKTLTKRYGDPRMLAIFGGIALPLPLEVHRKYFHSSMARRAPQNFSMAPF